MTPDNIIENYEPFGEEWKKEVSKLPKAYLIEQWKQSCLKRQKLEATEKQKDERIKELEDELKKYSDNEICSECGQPDGKHRKGCSEYYRYMMDNDSDLGAQS